MRTPRTFRRSLILKIFAPLAAVSLLATACGSSPSTPSSKTSSSNSTIVIAIPSDMQNLDPTLSSGDQVTQEVLTNIYSWLDDYDYTGTGSSANIDKFIGGAAQDWTVQDGGKTIVFHLRKGIKFANGDPLNAQAVKFTYNRIFAQNGVTAALMGMAGLTSQGVQVVNPTTVAFHLTKANDLFFGNLSQFGNSILDPKVVTAHEKNGDFAHGWLSTHATGTESGPYIISSWQPGNEVILKRNPNYWGTVRNQEVILKIVPDPSSRLADVESGAVDVAEQIPTNEVAQAQKDANVQLHINTSRQVDYIGMNVDKPPFNNQLFREAVDYAVPYQAIIKHALNGYGEQLKSIIPDGTPDRTDQYFTGTNLAKAKELLKQSGVKTPVNVTLTVPSGNYTAQQTAVWVESGLKNIGVNVTIDQMPGASYEKDLQAHSLAFFWSDWTSINNDPFYQFYWLLDSSCCDYTNYSNPTITNLINTNLLSTNASQRQAAAFEIQKLMAQGAPWIFLDQPDFITATHKGTTGFVWYSDAGYVRYRWFQNTGH